MRNNFYNVESSLVSILWNYTVKPLLSILTVFLSKAISPSQQCIKLQSSLWFPSLGRALFIPETHQKENIKQTISSML
jgi:hypothetical protein